MLMSWRETANAVINEVIQQNPELDPFSPEMEKLIRAAYPFGERNYHPYKIWCSAVNRHFKRERTKTQRNLDQQPKLF
jgi:hypothetical protein